MCRCAQHKRQSEYPLKRYHGRFTQQKMPCRTPLPINSPFHKSGGHRILVHVIQLLFRFLSGVQVERIILRLPERIGWRKWLSLGSCSQRSSTASSGWRCRRRSSLGAARRSLRRSRSWMPPGKVYAPPPSTPSKGLTGPCFRCKNFEIGAADKKMEEKSPRVRHGGGQLLE